MSEGLLYWVCDFAVEPLCEKPPETGPGLTPSWQSVMLGHLGLTNIHTDLACPHPNLGGSESSSLLVGLGDFQRSEDFLKWHHLPCALQADAGL